MSGDSLCHTALMRYNMSQGGGEGRGRQETVMEGRETEGCADTVTPAMMTWGEEGDGKG